MRKFRIFVAAISSLVCVCAFVWARWAGFQSVHGYFRQTWMMQQVMGKFCIFVAAISGWCVRCDATGESCENSAFLLRLFPACVCVYVCVYVCTATCNATESCENSVLSLRLFPAYVCVCLLCFLFGPGQAGFEMLVNCGYFQIWTECVPYCQLPHFATLIFGYS